MSAVWSLPGYEVEVLLGSGATGEVWQARELATGDRVALERLYEPVDLHTRAALERSARRLESVDSPYLVRLRAVVEDVLVLDHAPGGSLAALVGRRGRLTPGEVVTVVAPLASALASAHDRGLVHGDISASRVLFSAGGRPMLAGLGLPRRRIRREVTDVEPPSAAGDVRALASLCRDLLAPEQTSDAVGGAGQGPDAAALAAAVDGVLAAAPSRLPDAATFGSMLRRACPAEPVTPTGGSAPDRANPRPGPARSWVGASAAARAQDQVGGPGRPQARPARAGRRVHSRPRSGSADRRALPVLPGGAVVTLGSAVLVLAGAAFGWLSGRGEVPVAAAVAPPVGPLAVSASVEPPPLPTPPLPTPPAPDWPEVLDGLDSARARAFAAVDLRTLADVWAPGSPGLVADTGALQQLAAAGQTAHGVRHDVREVRAVTVPAVADREAAEPAGAEASVRLEVLDVLGAQEIRDNAGNVARTVAAREAATWLIELVRTPTGWRLRSVSPLK